VIFIQLVVGVRFKKAGKIYYFDPNGLDLKPTDHVIVETVRGIEYGEVVVAPKMVFEEDIVSPLKKVIRKATQEDEQKVKENRQKEKEAFEICLREIAKHGLPMKLIDVEYTFDNNKVIFYFTAEGRVDFRELVKDLAAIFRTRIELRQIGVRDEAKMIGGLGCCGRRLCCATFLGDFEPVSIRMAKEQNLSLNPAKISGVCGRLMCCLNFEQPIYEEVIRRAPKINKEVWTPDGIGTVVELNVLFEKVKVKLVQNDGTVEIKEYPLADIKYLEDQTSDEQTPVKEDGCMEIDEEILSLMDE
jgi:cell fate regulator YaaT (PSP1 superfamily)